MREYARAAALALLIGASAHAQRADGVPKRFQEAATLQATQRPNQQVPLARDLPDDPSVKWEQGTTRTSAPCTKQPLTLAPEADVAAEARSPCVIPAQNPYKRFLDNGKPIPLSPRQKGFLAFHDIVDPFNLLTIAANSAFTVGVDSHTAYGSGMKGFGRSVGYSFLQDTTGEVIGTFGICSLLHEDPHYHRMPSGRPFERVVHAISRTLIAQHDDGTPMPNYEILITYPAAAEISNLYVPGVHGNGPSTVARIFTGFATDPINNIITEFLPDFAKRFHVRVVFLQQIINQVASGQPGSP